MHYQRFRYRGTLNDIVPTPRRTTCAHCQKPFDSITRRWGAIYCSVTCKEASREGRRWNQEKPPADCLQCGIPLPLVRRVDQRFCNGRCNTNWRNKQAAALTLAAKAHRPPCIGCGGTVAAERTGNALYCSERCKIRSRRHEAYGLTKAELELLLKQHATCAICQTDHWGKKGPCVDHDHATGKIRGILCGSCNQGLGRFSDDPTRLRAAAAYLEAHMTT